MHKAIHPFVLICGLLWLTLFSGSAAGQGGFLIFGRVSLPDGQPAVRVRVFIETTSGLKRDVLTDQEGNYEFRGMAAGRYRVHAINPDVPEQFSEPAESDTTRAFANRLQINVYLRLPLHDDKKDAKPGTISLVEANQNIPKAAHKAFEQGLKLQKENQPDKALVQFNQAIALYPGYFQALTERGNLQMERHQLSEAAADFSTALQHHAKYAPALRGLGYCQLQQKQYEAAIGNLERAYAAAPKVALTLMLLGFANLSVGRYEPARQCLQEALRLDEASAARAHVYLGEILAREEKFTEAADAVRAYLRVKPNATDAAQLKELETKWRAQGKATPSKP